MDQTACKPGSVPPGAEAPDAAIIPLDRPSRDGSRDLPGPLRPTTALPSQEANFPGGRTVPIRSCSWRGLPSRPCCQRRGGLLPHPFTLPAPERGGLLSVALSLGSPPAGVTRRHVVVEPGLSSTPLRKPRSPGRLVRAEPEGLTSRGQGARSGSPRSWGIRRATGDDWMIALLVVAKGRKRSIRTSRSPTVATSAL